MPRVNLPGTRRLDITCDHVMVGLQTLRRLPAVRSATVFGQSIHLLVEESCTDDELRAELGRANIGVRDIRGMGPSLEDVFVSLTNEGLK